MSFSNKTFPTLATPMNSVMSFHSCPPYMQESNPVFTDWSIFQNKETLPAPEDEEIMLGHNYTPKSRLEEIPPFPLDESIKEPEEQSHVNNYDQIQKL